MPSGTVQTLIKAHSCFLCMCSTLAGLSFFSIDNKYPSTMTGNLPIDLELLLIFQVFLKAMAETGQVKLYGEHPTLTETSLYRARRHLFKDERYHSSLI